MPLKLHISWAAKFLFWKRSQFVENIYHLSSLSSEQPIILFRAPTDCAQYITGQSGSIKSYNWPGGDQITGMQYTYCIRREAGYCSITYQQATGTTIDAFQTDDVAITNTVIDFYSLITHLCTLRSFPKNPLLIIFFVHYWYHDMIFSCCGCNTEAQVRVRTKLQK